MVRNLNQRVLWYCHTPLRDIYDLYNYRLSLRKPHERLLYIVGASVVRRIDKGVTKNIEFIFANSNNTLSRIKKYYGRNDAQVLNGGIEANAYHNSAPEKYFFYPSRISPNKRQDYALRAFERFKQIKKGYKLIICGPVSKDPFYYSYYKRIKQMARRIGSTTILTDVDEKRMRKLYSHATATLYPPMNEDYGLVPLESMASGKPVIAVNEGGPRETILANKTGFLVNSEIEMADKMRVIADSPAYAQSMGKAGIIHVRKSYSWEKFFKTFDKKARQVSKL